MHFLYCNEKGKTGFENKQEKNVTFEIIQKLNLREKPTLRSKGVAYSRPFSKRRKLR